MNEQLEKLRAQRNAAIDAIDALKAERQAITDQAKEEQREELSPEETDAFRAKTAEVREKMDTVDSLDEQIRELEAEVERSGRMQKEAREAAKSQARVEVTNEARTYEKGNGHSYVQDLLKRHFRLDDEESEARLKRHAAEVRTDKEYRDLDRTDGSGGYEMATIAA